MMLLSSIYIYIHLSFPRSRVNKEDMREKSIRSIRAMHDLPDLKVHVNGHSTFFLNQSTLSKYSGLVRKMVNQEKKNKSKNKIAELEIKIDGFPGGSTGFELATRFCYNNGGYPLTPANLPLLHSASIFLAMDEDVARCNLHHQAETFLDGLFYWTWSDLLSSLRACEPLFPIADSSGLLHKLISSLLVKMAAVSSSSSSSSSSGSSSSSSPEYSSGGSASRAMYPARKAWWFDDLTGLSPRMVEKMFKIMGVYGRENNNMVLTRFLLHYLKVAAQRRSGGTVHGSIACGGLAATAVHGVVSLGRMGFSCRGLFWVWRVVSGLGVGRGVRGVLEGLIGGVLDQASLDDLLVLGHGVGGGFYDVGLVVRLLRVFAVFGGEEEGKEGCLLRMKKVGRLMDRYMREISPDRGLKVSKFLGVAEGLPDAARDCFDGVYNAVDIYLESHPSLSFEERSKLCRCLNYEKLTLECCRDLAKNPRIPPKIAIQALASWQSRNQPASSPDGPSSREAQSGKGAEIGRTVDVNEEMRVNLERMQLRVMELEKVCTQMKNQMSNKVKGNSMVNSAYHKNLPKLC